MDNLEYDQGFGNQSGDVAVKHTAESDRHSCLCERCIAWRKTMGLELGEVPVKKASRFARKK